MPARTLSHAEAEAFYDRIGKRQDSQRFYEDVALDALVAHGRFERCRDLLEVGCGTGRFAKRLLRDVLPGDARYLGLDVSATMVELARERLTPFGERARVEKTEGSMKLDLPEETFDRVVATYLADLLSDEDIRAFLDAAWQVSRPNGLLGVTGLTEGKRPASRLVTALWRAVHRLRPSLVGGCRPLVLAPRLDGNRWRPIHREIVQSFAIPSEVLIAEKVL